MGISGSVGRGGSNRFADAVHVQGLLNQSSISNRGALLVVDGLVGPKTIAAITQFQAQSTGARDGRIDPDGRTLKALEGSNPDLACRPLARAITGLCDQVMAAMPASGLPLNHLPMLQVRNNVRNSVDALRPHIGAPGTTGGRYAFASFPSTVPMAFALAAVPLVAILTALILLIGAIVMLLLLHALLPAGMAATSKLAAEIERQKFVLMRTLGEAMVQIVIFVNDAQRVLDRCKPKGNAQQLLECQRALDEAARVLKNILFKLDALKLLWHRKMSGPPNVIDLNDFRTAKQLIEELLALVRDMEAAIARVLAKCGCHFVVG